MVLPYGEHILHYQEVPLSGQWIIKRIIIINKDQIGEGIRVLHRPLNTFLFLINNIRESFPFMKKVRMANWWLNVNEKGDFNFRHTHPKCDLSGIWYITDNNNTLVFEDPMQHTRSNLYMAFPELDIGEGVYVNAKAGEILIFPADLPHYVEPHPLDTQRVSVSFNMHLID